MLRGKFYRSQIEPHYTTIPLDCKEKIRAVGGVILVGWAGKNGFIPP